MITWATWLRTERLSSVNISSTSADSIQYSCFVPLYLGLKQATVCSKGTMLHVTTEVGKVGKRGLLTAGGSGDSDKCLCFAERYISGHFAMFVRHCDTVS